MKAGRLFFIIFLLSAVSLFISLILFWNQGIFVDEYNLSPEIVCGGVFWNAADWLRLLFLFLLSVFSAFGWYKNKN